MPGAKLHVSERTVVCTDRTVGGTDRSEKERSAGAPVPVERISDRAEPIAVFGEPKIIRGMEIIDRSEAP
jgi:hypothetical protein